MRRKNVSTHYKPPSKAARGNLAIDRAARAAIRHPREVRRIEDVVPTVRDRVAEQRASSPERAGT